MINDLLWRESQLGQSSFQKDILILLSKILGFETKDHERESNQIQKCVPLVNLLLSINPSLQELVVSDDYSINIIITCMGTKIVERTTTNSFGLKTVDRCGFIRFGVNGQRKSSKETLTDDVEDDEAVFVIRSLMDRFLEKQNAESIRHTMQAQEDIFKQQVRELHRVYNIQKMMMDQLKHRSQHCTINNKDQTGPRERTGSWSGIDLENVVRATNTTADHIEESELELTLSIGMSSSSTNKDMDYSSTTSFRSSSDNCNNQSNNNNNNSNNQESSGPNTPMSSSSTTSLDREKKRPHWLFQGLSINRTS